MFDPEIIRAVQLVQMESLRELDRICKKFDIQYWIAYGTLIGAVRHQGFIPWDDDLDVGMLREDYEKLIRIPKEEWGEKFLLLDAMSDDPRHDVLFCRLYQNNTRVQSARDLKSWTLWEDGSTWGTSLALDIFIFDYVPDDDCTCHWIYRRCLANRSYYQGYCFRYRNVKLKPKIVHDTPKSVLVTLIRQIYSRIMRRLYKKPWVTVWKQHELLVKKAKKGSRIGTFTTSDPFYYEALDFFPLVSGTFEDMTVPMPKCWDRCLRDMYGDYMQYPPEAERQHLNFAFIDLGDGRQYRF